MAKQIYAGQVAGEGIRLIKANPVAFAVWVGLYIALTLVGFLATFTWMKPLFENFGAEAARVETDPAAMAAMFGALGKLLLLFVPMSLAFAGVLYGAIYRAVLRPKETSTFYLRLGGDELRLVGAMLLAWFLFSLAVVVYFGLSVALVAVAAAVAGWLSAVLGVAAAVGGVALIVLLGVRLSLIMPMAFETRSIQVREAWRLTKGHFWSIFGAYVLVFVLLMVIATVLQLLIAFGSGGIQAELQAALAAGESIDVWRGREWQFGLYAVLSGALNAFEFVFFAAPAAAIYSDLTRQTQTAADAFS